MLQIEIHKRIKIESFEKALHPTIEKGVTS